MLIDTCVWHRFDKSGDGFVGRRHLANM
jgi:hypothetical protein